MHAALNALIGRGAVLLALGWGGLAGAQAALVAPDLAAELAVRGPQEEIAVILVLTDQVDPQAHAQPDRRQRDTGLARALREKAAATQGPHRVFLQNQGARGLRELWLLNGMAATVRASVVRQLSLRPGIGRIGLDATLQAPVTSTAEAALPEWNLSAVGAPPLWTQGQTGAGIVVAGMDTGVDAAHPDLAPRWRGGSNSWFDPHGQHATPYDASGHGTQTLGIVLGGAAGGSAIGIAPDARWIAAKLYNDAGQARYSDIHLAFQWLLDPDGDLATVDAPDVVNASWGLIGTAGQCIAEFSADIALLRTAGIAVAWAAGNDGPAPATSLSPANDAQGFSVGAVDGTLALAGFSSRGPSACSGAVYPSVVAPGVAVRTADLSFGGLPQYVAVTGTSFAAPHAAGALALLAGAFPGASVERLEAALTASARDLGVAGEDNSHGWGLIDLPAAMQWLAADPNSAPRISSTPPTGASAGSPYRYAVAASDPDGDALAFALDLAPTGMVIGAVSGLIDWTPGSEQVGSQAVTVRVSDGRGASAVQSFTVAVAQNLPPLARDDLATAAMRKGASYRPVRVAVLANDSDPDGQLDPASVRIVAPPSQGGSVTVNADGTLAYTPRLKFRGSESFRYSVRDQAGAESASASVTVTVK